MTIEGMFSELTQKKGMFKHSDRGTERQIMAKEKGKRVRGNIDWKEGEPEGQDILCHSHSHF